MKLCETLVFLRKKNYYQQEDVADMLKISRVAYSHYETGRRTPTANVLVQLSKIYHVSIDYLLDANRGE